MLTGQAKVDYQRSYMRKRRSNACSTERSNKPPISVRPVTLPVRPAGISESQWNYIKMKAVVK